MFYKITTISHKDSEYNAKYKRTKSKKSTFVVLFYPLKSEFSIDRVVEFYLLELYRLFFYLLGHRSRACAGI